MLFGETLSPLLLEMTFLETNTDFLVFVFLRSLDLFFGFLYSVFSEGFGLVPPLVQFFLFQ